MDRRRLLNSNQSPFNRACVYIYEIYTCQLSDMFERGVLEHTNFRVHSHFCNCKHLVNAMNSCDTQSFSARGKDILMATLCQKFEVISTSEADCVSVDVRSSTAIVALHPPVKKGTKFLYRWEKRQMLLICLIVINFFFKIVADYVQTSFSSLTIIYKTLYFWRGSHEGYNGIWSFWPVSKPAPYKLDLFKVFGLTKCTSPQNWNYLIFS